MGYLVKKAAGAPYEGHVASSNWGTDGRLYHDDVANQLRILNRLYKTGKIDKASYKAYQKELVAQVDPQQLHNSFINLSGDEAAAHKATKRFFSDSVARGLMDRQSASQALSTARRAPKSGRLAFSYTPGRWVDTRTGETYNPNAPVVNPVKRKALPKLPKAAPPVQLAAAPEQGYTLSALSPTQAPAPTVTTSAPVEPSPAPAPASVPVKKPKIDPYKQALENGWAADDTTYGRGWVSRKNADGTTTYKSPNQLRTGKGSITVGPSDAQKPVAAPTAPAQPKK